jgi:hypothetical protein
MPSVRRLDPQTLRAAVWAYRASRRARRQLSSHPIDHALVGLPRVPSLPDDAEHGVAAVLAMRRESCLVRAVVRQAWEAAHDRPRELVIGVAPLEDGQLKAHAWLDGDPPQEDQDYRELLRRGAPPRR